MWNAFDLCPFFPGTETDDQNAPFGLAMYHCLVASRIDLDNWGGEAISIDAWNFCICAYRFRHHIQYGGGIDLWYVRFQQWSEVGI
jgi:hypothetical protein